MEGAPGIREPAHELAAIIDPISIGVCGARDVDRGEAALVQEKTALRAADIDVGAHDLAEFIDPEGLGERGARDVDRGEDAVVQEKTLLRRLRGRHLNGPSNRYFLTGIRRGRWCCGVGCYLNRCQ
jgi:hypothetical protein